MNARNALYRFSSAVCHALTARNSKGEGIHSPYLFELVRMVLYDTHPYYFFAPVEQRRYAMLHASKRVDCTDYGTGGKHGMRRQRLVSDIARTSLEPPMWGQTLFRLTNWLGHQARGQGREGLHIVELGTSLGITTAYLAGVDSHDRITTFEGCPDIAALAQRNWDKLGLHNIRCVVGNIDDTLAAHLSGPVDLAFLDANHTCEATLRYYDILAPHFLPKSVAVIDDIHYSPSMARAWRTLCRRPEVTTAMDFGRAGMLFFDPRYLHRLYKLRL